MIFKINLSYRIKTYQCIYHINDIKFMLPVGGIKKPPEN